MSQKVRVEQLKPATIDTYVVTTSGGTVVWAPASITSFTGNTSATCITDLYVTNVNSCSPLHIQPVNTGDVYISENGGSVGIGTTSTSSKLHIKGVDSSANNSSLKVVHSGNTNLFVVRNDGHITAGVGTSLTIGVIAKFDNTQVNNTSIGYNTGGGNRNTFIGAGAGAAVTTSAAGRNVAVGNGAGGSFTTDFGHTAIGWSALGTQFGRTSTADGQMNVAIGYNTMQVNRTGTANTAVGSNSLQSNTGGTNNVALGGTAGQLSTGSNNLFLGYNAGRNQTSESNQLFIDNIGRTTKALELTNALIRGTFNSTVANQYLRFNASVGIGLDATSRLHIQSLGSTSATYGIKLDDSSLNPMFYIRDDGVMTFGTSTPVTNSKYTFVGHVKPDSISVGSVATEINQSSVYSTINFGLLIGSASVANIVSVLPAAADIADGTVVTFFRSDAIGGNSWTISGGTGTVGFNQFAGVFGSSTTIPPATGGNVNMKKFQWTSTFSQWIQIG